MKRIIFSVTNDLSYDQRMQRICTSLAEAGHEVLLVGRLLKDSIPLSLQKYEQKRLRCVFNKGLLFYAEFNTRLFLYLLFRKASLLCAIDLDTILPVLFVSRIKRIKRVYDAHELFCEMKEIVTRPRVYKVWKKIERFSVPQFKDGYTVNQVIANEFRNMYGVQYAVVRNMPLYKEDREPVVRENYVLYQGAVNEGRSFETLIPAFASIDTTLVICRDGNFMDEAKKLVEKYRLSDKIIFTGKLLPDQLRKYTAKAKIGVTLFDDTGLSNYYSLANRFFDYMHAGVPQICVDYPVYRETITEFPFALLIKDLGPASIAQQINLLLNDEKLYRRLQENCMLAQQKLNWQQEEVTLRRFYNEKLDDRG